MNRITTFWTWALAMTALLGLGLMSSSALSPRMARMAAAESQRQLPPPGNPMTMDFFMPGADAGAAAAKNQVVDGGDDAGGANPEVAAAAGVMVVNAGGGLPSPGFASAFSFSPAADDRPGAVARASLSVSAGPAASAGAAAASSSSPGGVGGRPTPSPTSSTPTSTTTTPTTTPTSTPTTTTPSAPATPNPVVTPPVVTPPVNPPVVNPPVNPPVVNPPNPPVDPDCPTDEPCDGVVIPGASRPGFQAQDSVKTLQSRLKLLVSGGKSSRTTNAAFSSIRQANIERVCEQLRLQQFHHPDCNVHR